MVMVIEIIYDKGDVNKVIHDDGVISYEMMGGNHGDNGLGDRRIDELNFNLIILFSSAFVGVYLLYRIARLIFVNESLICSI
jgi:hypothetical protein